jgi:NAD(P)-dependent dehydrogenase (short-subunit alcohol dehydrogenase family)
VSTVVLTGSAGGIGTATRHHLEGAGRTVIGVDLHDAEIVTDLSTDDGRHHMLAEVERMSGGSLDGVIACAGVIDADEDHIVSTNYFGAIATLDGLRPLLARGNDASAIAISSNSTTIMPGVPDEIVERCLDGDEPAARRVAVDHRGYGYPCSKLALARWVRRRAVTDEWAGAGIRLNAVSPGLVDTPLNDGKIDLFLSIPDVFPLPQGRAAQPEEIAPLLGFLLSADASFFCGSVIFVDGGSDAAMRADDWPTALS